MRKGTKWAIVAVSCCLLASLARACAPGYEKTNATPTTNQAPAPTYNYVEEHEKNKEQFYDIFGQEETQTNSLGK